jgi:phospholipid/cholesterol/gamma-HCH transport system permease protein
VALIAILLGAIVPTQAMTWLGTDNEVVLKNVVWGGIAELGPLVTALVLVVRSGVAIAAETALMRLRAGMSDALWLGAAHEDEVVIPRVFGLALSAALLVAYFQAFAIAAALVASAVLLGTPLMSELDYFLNNGVWWQVVVAVGKGAVFGLGIGVVSCYHGLHAKPQASAIPKAAVAAGVGSLTFVFAVDVFAAWLRFL